MAADVPVEVPRRRRTMSSANPQTELPRGYRSSQKNSRRSAKLQLRTVWLRIENLRVKN